MLLCVYKGGHIMTHSKSKKQRMKQVREGRLDPQSSRGSWNGVCPIERKTPTRLEKLNRAEKKYKKGGYLLKDNLPFSMRIYLPILLSKRRV